MGRERWVLLGPRLRKSGLREIRGMGPVSLSRRESESELGRRRRARDGETPRNSNHRHHRQG